MGYAGFFPRAPGGDEARGVRRSETVDIVSRVGVLSPKRLFLSNYPVGNPIAAFNSSLAVEDGVVLLHVRVIVGYYKYVSAIAETRVFMEDVESGDVSINYYAGRIVVHPSTRYDVWGAEDPRTYRLGDRLLMTYTGRTRHYFDPGRRERTLPVTAVRTGEGEEAAWRKAFVTVMPQPLREHVVTDKNAFLVKVNGDYLFFHRLHMDDDRFYLVVSRLDPREVEEALSRPGAEPREIVLRDTVLVMEPAPFEQKLGWAAPPIQLGGGRLLALIHGVGRSMGVYRVAATLLSYSRSEGVTVEAVTPTYIMEPRTMYEVYGDRPYTVFPCGAWRLDRRRLLISYGAADYMTGLGLINLEKLMALLDEGRVD